MAGKIPQQFIDDILARTDIVELIDARVTLKKAGKDFQACCPFHNEKTPSFTVSQNKQFYHCFGCGAHGSAIGFLMEYDNLDFVEAIQELADTLSLEVPREDGGTFQRPTTDTKALFALTELANDFYQIQLRQHAQKQEAVDYLKGRGLSGQIAKRFALGFCADEWRAIQTALGSDEGRREQLVEVGLLIKKSANDYYDRFRHRIMFPIRDLRGRVVGFGGRVLGDGTPKYLNSPETPLFHKGKELYGFYEACQSNRKLKKVLVVEGYMDVVALAQHGITYAVATLGTATSVEHVERLFRKVEDIIFCFDGDRAGRDAAWRALEHALPTLREGRQIRFLFLPDGEDPDTLVRQEGYERFSQRIAQANTLSQYLFDHLGKDTDASTIDGRARLAEAAKPLLKKLPGGTFQQMMIAELAQRTRIDVNLLSIDISGNTVKPTQTANRYTATTNQRGPSLVRKTITVLLHRPDLAKTTENGAWLKDIDQAGIILLIDLLELLHQHPHLSTGGILEHWRDTEHGRHLSKLAAQPSLLGSDALAAEWSDTLSRLRKTANEAQLERLEERDRLGIANAEEKAEIKRRYQKLGQHKD
ncbi:DNA primase [Gammaproteobacteria bacterium AH-315-M22]|nr:DNA primase [Gammaproteobacteria bacterium AH-315-M22]